MAESNAQYLSSWIEVDDQNDFPIQNIPFGVFRKIQNGFAHHIASRIGNSVIDLYRIASKGYFDDCGIIDVEVFNQAFIKYFCRSWVNLLCERFVKEFRNYSVLIIP